MQHPAPVPAVKILRTPASAARWSRALPAAKRPLALVPTMGALHAGHVALVEKARRLAGPRGTVAVSIFVNPAQFGPREDFSRYPRPVARDLALCRAHGVDAVFLPSAAAMYPTGYSTYVDELALSQTLCGKSRPGHFRGVCTVVLKLFNILSPDAAVFGEKDAQQLAVIRRMARDLNLAVKIVPLATVREADGLALSSRNQYLSAEERAQAPALRQALLAAAELARGGVRDAGVLRDAVVEMIGAAPLGRIDYVEVVDAETLAPVTEATGKILIACAVYFGKTRLIDNLTV